LLFFIFISAITSIFQLLLTLLNLIR